MSKKDYEFIASVLKQLRAEKLASNDIYGLNIINEVLLVFSCRLKQLNKEFNEDKFFKAVREQ